jgi:hypothetical protein
VRAAVDKDLLDARVGQELERVLDERRVREGQQTLRAGQQAPRICSRRTDPRALEREGAEACLEGIGEYLGS